MPEYTKERALLHESLHNAVMYLKIILTYCFITFMLLIYVSAGQNVVTLRKEGD